MQAFVAIGVEVLEAELMNHRAKIGISKQQLALYEERALLKIELFKRQFSGFDKNGKRNTAKISPMIMGYAVVLAINMGKQKYEMKRKQRPELPSWSTISRYNRSLRTKPGIQYDGKFSIIYGHYYITLFFLPRAISFAYS